MLSTVGFGDDKATVESCLGQGKQFGGRSRENVKRWDTGRKASMAVSPDSPHQSNQAILELKCASLSAMLCPKVGAVSRADVRCGVLFSFGGPRKIFGQICGCALRRATVQLAVG